jgi:hypothetical protein
LNKKPACSRQVDEEEMGKGWSSHREMKVGNGPSFRCHFKWGLVSVKGESDQCARPVLVKLITPSLSCSFLYLLFTRPLYKGLLVVSLFRITPRLQIRISTS